MKNLVYFLVIFTLFSFESKDFDCDNIAKIIFTPEFEKCFAICQRADDKVVIYIAKYGDLDPSVLCSPLTMSCGKPVTFAEINFEVKLNDDPRGKIMNARIVVWKENNQYHFFQTSTNRKLIASFKRGKVNDIITGVF